MNDNRAAHVRTSMYSRPTPPTVTAARSATILLAAAAFCLVPAGCATSRRVVQSLTANCREVGPGVANEMLRDNPHVLLLDVRHPAEFSPGLPHLLRCREIPLSELPRRFREISSWKNETVVIFSRDGTDAASACEFLARQGFVYVSHVEGGVEEWQRRRFGNFNEARS